MLLLTKAFCRTSRFAMLLLALIVPCGTLAVAECLMSIEAESETCAESCEECVSIANEAQTRRKRVAVRRLDVSTFACQTKQLSSPQFTLAADGHRIGHEQLAPLRL